MHMRLCAWMYKQHAFFTFFSFEWWALYSLSLYRAIHRCTYSVMPILVLATDQKKKTKKNGILSLRALGC